ncbi:unnamed protein product [Amoebophrya sp. A120]|nr:unnamed protein product [Amoebophrya sp. A120]|eukprot:GSA120T00017678001.1
MLFSIYHYLLGPFDFLSTFSSFSMTLLFLDHSDASI